MINVKVNQFKGLYTNIPSDISSFEVFNFIEGKILKDKIVAEKLIAEKIEDLENIVYIGSFILDSDRYERVWNKDKFEYENNYSNEFKNVLLIVTREENKYYVSLYSNGEYLKIKTSVNDKDGNNRVLLNGKFNKAVSYDGAINIFTDKGIQVIKNLNKKLRFNYAYDGIYLFDNIPNYEHFLDIEIVDENRKVNKTVEVRTKFLRKEIKIEEHPNVLGLNNTRVAVIVKADLFLNNQYYGNLEFTSGYIVNITTSTQDTYNVETVTIIDVKVNGTPTKIVMNNTVYENSRSTQYEVNLTSNAITTIVGTLYLFLVNLYNFFNEGVLITINYENKVKEAFNDNYNFLDIYLTAKLLNGNEKVLLNKRIDKASYQGKYALLIKFTPIILKFISINPYTVELNDIYDLESFRLYVGNKDTKGELVREYSIYGDDFEFSYEDIIDKTNLSGIHIEQTCGSAINYEYEDIFDDVVVVRGVLFAKKGSRVFYPVIGNGNVTTSYLKDNYISNIKANYLADINGSLGVFSDDKLLVLHFDSEDNTLLFTLKDEMGFNIRDYRDLAYSPDGILILTKGGIYATNVQNIQLLSEAINNIIYENIDNLNLVYNIFTNEVLLIAPQMIYMYDFVQQIWKNNSIDKEIKDIVYDNMGNLYYYTDNEFGKLIYKPSKCKIISKDITLNELNVYKRINYFKINGKGNIKLKLNDKEYVKNLNFDNIIFVMLKDRIPQKVFKYEIELDENAEIYGYAINLELIKDRHEYIVQT